MSDDRYEEGYEDGLKDGWDGGREEAINDFRDDDGASMDGIKTAAYQDGYQEGYRIAIRSECAAGPWQPMETAPKNGEAVLLLIEYDGNTITAIGHNHGFTGWCVPGNNDIAINGVCKKWARINRPEEEVKKDK